MTNTRTKADERITRGEILGHLTALAYNTKTLTDLLGEVKPNDWTSIILIADIVDKMKEHADEMLNESSK